MEWPSSVGLYANILIVMSPPRKDEHAETKKHLKKMWIDIPSKTAFAQDHSEKKKKKLVLSQAFVFMLKCMHIDRAIE